ncbi:hypothetical protein VTN77DRAFT_6858 [Rasamsonia byssochlamydoides]|uniref:uncharacterized protein n=1 Tax=Rasamsonia byssochlamydoides TaxID=89139 RepID=UPI003743516C
MASVEKRPQPGPPRRRKFSKPPVKVACLSCRSLRTRCDGQQQCANCIARGTPCCYTPSRRGGPRVRGVTAKKNEAKKNEKHSSPREESGDANNPDMNLDDDAWFNQVVSLSEPGAGLRNVEMSIAEIESIFDSIFAPERDDPISSNINNKTAAPMTHLVQIYASDQDVLDAYYVFIHPYYPILPPPERVPSNRPLMPGRTSSFAPSTPLSLAISALLVLIPHPHEQEDPSRLDYVRLRRDYAHSFAQSALEAIEVDSELLDSSSDPSNALSDGSPLRLNREPFHPRVPVNLESVLALILLSVYEYAQRGNMAKMRNRAGQALTAAMSMSLHEALEEDEFAEARRRAWWMTYVTVCQGSIVSNTPAVLDVYDPRFVTPYPTFASDTEGWRFFIESQRTILAATTFVHELDKEIKAGSDSAWIAQRMQELDHRIESVLLMRKGPPFLSQLPIAAPVDASEAVVARAMRSIAEIKLHSARIKTHRFSAFFDIPIFRKRHCDLGVVNINPSPPPSNPSSSSCTCRSHIGSLPSPPDSDGSNHSRSSVEPGPGPAGVNIRFPFSSHVSSKICLHAALNIVTLLDNLPYPNPNPTNGSMNMTRAPPRLSPRSPIEVPRTMPTFACCAVQSSYAMLMLCLKTRILHQNRKNATQQRAQTQTSLSGNDDAAACDDNQDDYDDDGADETDLLTEFMNDLYQGLQLVIKSLANYSIAFEALQGMKNEISHAVERTFGSYHHYTG